MVTVVTVHYTLQ
uniref:Uncharacterized protein n=1 Tax=Arundo donax TaxID=35708 RepID=A0A0A9BN94_ARUDO